MINQTIGVLLLTLIAVFVVWANVRYYRIGAQRLKLPPDVQARLRAEEADEMRTW